ncbi:MAG: glycosyltransferase family 39 protein, partial [Candidatus Scalindua sp.]|nr:glycosyltransferase family 39 protein [Candidatus Scalindua sp.]
YVESRQRFRQGTSRANIHNFSHFLPKDLNFLEALLIVVIVMSIGLVSFQALFKPMFTYDAMSIWALKAKIFFKEQTIFTDDFYNSDRLHYHPKYPLLIPLVENWIYHCLGSVNDKLVKIIFPLFYVSLISILYTTQRKFFSRQYSLIFTALLATIPAFVRSDKGGATFSGNADIPLAFFYATGVIYPFCWMKERRRADLFVSAIFSGLAIFTKNEGLGFFAVTVFCISIYIFFNSKKGVVRQNIESFSVYVIIPILIVLPWLILSMGMPIFLEEENYPGHLTIATVIGNISRTPVILSSFCFELLDIRRWNIFWVLFGVAIIGGFKFILKSSVKYLLLMLILDFCLFVLVYLVTPWDVKELISCSMTRLVIQTTPIAVFIVSQQMHMVLDCRNGRP